MDPLKLFGGASVGRSGSRGGGQGDDDAGVRHQMTVLNGVPDVCPAAVTAEVLEFRPGGRSAAVLRWEAALERGVAAFIAEQLTTSPCPGPSRVACDLSDWGAGLLLDAQSRLESAAARQARPAPSALL